MRRREFFTLLSSAAAWPLAARAQQAEQMRRIGILTSLAVTDPEAQTWDDAFRKRLEALGWVDGRNVHFDRRWGTVSIEHLQQSAKEFVRLNPDMLLAITTPATAALQAETRTIPIVFAAVSDPVGSGFIASLAKPGGNITGFIDIEASLSGKWLELMREVAPHVSRVGMMFNPKTAPHARYYLDTFRSAAAKLSIEPIEAAVDSPSDVEAVIAKIGYDGGGGLIVMPEASAAAYRTVIFANAIRYRLPTICPGRIFATDGGLISYGIDWADLLRDAATYADRILRGAKPSELPAQLPTKFELIINLKTAKALRLTIPQSMLLLADEVIE